MTRQDTSALSVFAGLVSFLSALASLPRSTALCVVVIAGFVAVFHSLAFYAARVYRHLSDDELPGP